MCVWICFIIFLFCSSFASYISARGVSLDWLTKKIGGNNYSLSENMEITRKQFKLETISYLVIID